MLSYQLKGLPLEDSGRMTGVAEFQNRRGAGIFRRSVRVLPNQKVVLSFSWTQFHDLRSRKGWPGIEIHQNCTSLDILIDNNTLQVVGDPDF